MSLANTIIGELSGKTLNSYVFWYHEPPDGYWYQIECYDPDPSRRQCCGPNRVFQLYDDQVTEAAIMLDDAAKIIGEHSKLKTYKEKVNYRKK